MTRVELTPEQLSDAGVKPAGKYTAITADGVYISNPTSRVIVHVKATTAASITVSTAYTYNGLTFQDRVIALGAGEECFIGPFDRTIYNQSGTQEVWIDSDQLDTQILALTFPQT